MRTFLRRFSLAAVGFFAGFAVAALVAEGPVKITVAYDIGDQLAAVEAQDARDVAAVRSRIDDIRESLAAVSLQLRDRQQRTAAARASVVDAVVARYAPSFLRRSPGAEAVVADR